MRPESRSDEPTRRSLHRVGELGRIEGRPVVRRLDTAHLLAADGLEIARDRLERVEGVPRVGRGEPAQVDAPAPAARDLLEVPADPVLAAGAASRGTAPAGTSACRRGRCPASTRPDRRARLRQVALLGAERLAEASDQLGERGQVHVHPAALRRVVERPVGEDLEIHAEHLLAHLQREPEAVRRLGRRGHRGEALELGNRLLRATATRRSRRDHDGHSQREQIPETPHLHHHRIAPIARRCPFRGNRSSATHRLILCGGAKLGEAAQARSRDAASSTASRSSGCAAACGTGVMRAEGSSPLAASSAYRSGRACPTASTTSSGRASRASSASATRRAAATRLSPCPAEASAAASSRPTPGTRRAARRRRSRRRSRRGAAGRPARSGADRARARGSGACARTGSRRRARWALRRARPAAPSPVRPRRPRALRPEGSS